MQCPNCQERELRVNYIDVKYIEFELDGVQEDGSIDTGGILDYEYDGEPVIDCPKCGEIPLDQFMPDKRYWVNWDNNGNNPRPPGMFGLVDEDQGGEIAWFHDERVAEVICRLLNAPGNIDPVS